MNLAEPIFAEIDRLRGAMTDFLQRLVQFPSLPGQEQEAQHFMAQKLRTLGGEVKILRSDFAQLEHHPAFCDDGVSFADRLNIIGRWPGTGGGRS